MAKGKGKIVRDGLNGSVTHLLHRALQLALDYHADAAGSASLTQRQFTVLAAAAAADGLTQNDLVRAIGIDRSTLAYLVARMLGLLSPKKRETFLKTLVGLAAAADEPAKGRAAKKPPPPKAEKPQVKK